MLIDTHAHMWWPSFVKARDGESELDEVLSKARAAGVEKIIMPGTDLETSRAAVELAKKYPGKLYAAVGVHPEEVAGGISGQVEELRQLSVDNPECVVAIGEVGTDANTAELIATMSQQQEWLKAQALLSVELDLPLIIHTRQSLAETLLVLDSLPVIPRGVFHCFSYDEAAMQEVLARGFVIGICGNVTWSKRLQKVVRAVPSTKYLLETDSPFMIPRLPDGRPVDASLRNTPENVRMLASWVANLRGENVNIVEGSTTQNARELFKL